MSSTGEQCFSGGVDGTIQCWNTPNPNIDPYDSYGNILESRFVFVVSFDNPRISTKTTKLCCVFCDRPVSASWRVEWTHWLRLGFGIQQCTPAPPLLLCRRDCEAVGCQHHLPCPCRVQRKQTYRPDFYVVIQKNVSECFLFFLRLKFSAFLCRTGSPLLCRPGVQWTSLPGHILHKRGNWSLQHGDPSAGPQSGVKLGAR